MNREIKRLAKESKEYIVDAEKIIKQYCKQLQDMDFKISHLPCPKEELKHAFKIYITAFILNGVWDKEIQDTIVSCYSYLNGFVEDEKFDRFIELDIIRKEWLKAEEKRLKFKLSESEFEKSYGYINISEVAEEWEELNRKIQRYDEGLEKEIIHFIELASKQLEGYDPNKGLFLGTINLEPLLIKFWSYAETKAGLAAMTVLVIISMIVFTGCFYRF